MIKLTYRSASDKQAPALKIAKPADMSKAEEKYWKEAEKAAKKSYDPEEDPDLFYGTTTDIFKAKVKKHLGHDPFKKKKKSHYDVMKDFLLGKITRFAVDGAGDIQQLEDYQLKNRLSAVAGLVVKLQEAVEEAKDQLKKLTEAPQSGLGARKWEQANFLNRALEIKQNQLRARQEELANLQAEYTRRTGQSWQPTEMEMQFQAPPLKTVEEDPERTPQPVERKPQIMGGQAEGRQFVSPDELEYNPETGWQVSVAEMMRRVGAQVLRELGSLEGDQPVVMTEEVQLSKRRPLSFDRWVAENTSGRGGQEYSPIEEVDVMIKDPNNTKARAAALEKYEEYREEMLGRAKREETYTIRPPLARAMVAYILDPETVPEALQGIGPGAIAQLQQVAKMTQPYADAVRERLTDLESAAQAGRPIGMQTKVDVLHGEEVGLPAEPPAAMPKALWPKELRGPGERGGQFPWMYQRVKPQDLPKKKYGVNDLLNLMANVVKNAVERVSKTIRKPETMVSRPMRGEGPRIPGATQMRRQDRPERVAYDEPPTRSGKVQGELAQGSEGFIWRWNARQEKWEPQKKQEQFRPFLGGAEKQQELMGMEKEKPSALPPDVRIKSLEEWIVSNKSNSIIQAWIRDKKSNRLQRSVMEAYKDYVDAMQVEQQEVGVVPGGQRGVYRSPGLPPLREKPLAQFVWQGTDASGEPTSGVVEARDEEAAREQLAEQDISVSEINFRPRRKRRKKKTRESSFLNDLLTKLAIRRKRRKGKSIKEKEYLPPGAELKRELIPEEYKERVETPSEEVVEERMARQKHYAAEAQAMGLPPPPFDLDEAIEALNELREKATAAGAQVEADHGIPPDQVREELKRRKEAANQARDAWAALETQLEAKRKDPTTGEEVYIQMSPEQRDALQRSAFQARQAYEGYGKHFAKLANDERVRDLLKYQQELQSIANSLEFKIATYQKYLDQAEKMMKDKDVDGPRMEKFIHRLEALLGRQERLLDYHIQEGREYLIGPGQESDWRSHSTFPPRGTSGGESDRSPFSARRTRMPHAKE